ncbi:MAG: hypothetical protein ACOCSA_03130, partial [Candidatus Hadarchaeota archaeon]
LDKPGSTMIQGVSPLFFDKSPVKQHPLPFFGKLTLEACLRPDGSPPLSGGTGSVPEIGSAQKGQSRENHS